MTTPDHNPYSRKFHLKRVAKPRYRYIAEALLKTCHAAGIKDVSVLDIGSSVGCLLKQISVISGADKSRLCGIDYGQVVNEEFEHEYASYCNHDLTSGPVVISGGRFSAVVCQEVIEHIAPEHEANVISTIAFNRAPVSLVLFSAAVPGQKGYLHVNLRPPEYWTGKLAAAGMKQDQNLTGVYRSVLESIVEPQDKKDMWIYTFQTGVFV